MLAPLRRGGARLLSGASVDNSRPGQWTALFEVPTIFGVADFVLARVDRAVVARRGGGIPLNDSRLLKTVRDLHAAGGRATAAALASSGRISRAHMERNVLPRLIAAGWITAGRDGTWRSRRSYSCPVTTIIVVEAKLAALDKGVAQARGYAFCADHAYVALGSSPTPRALERVAVSAIGVAVVSEDGVNVVKPPDPSPHRDEHGYALLAEEITSMVDTYRVSGVVRPVFGQFLRGRDDPRFGSAAVVAL